MVYSRFNRNLIYFLAIAAAVLFVAALLQTSFLSQIDIFGAVPDLLLIFTVGIGLWASLAMLVASVVVAHCSKPKTESVAPMM